METDHLCDYELCNSMVTGGNCVLITKLVSELTRKYIIYIFL